MEQEQAEALGKTLGQICDGLDNPPAAALWVIRGMMSAFQPFDRKIVLACLEDDQNYTTAELREALKPAKPRESVHVPPGPQLPDAL